MRDRTLEKDEIREFGELVQTLRHPPYEYSWTQISNAAGYPAPGGARKAYDTRFKHVRVSNLVTLRRYIEALKHTSKTPGEQLGNPGSRRRPFMPPSDTVLVNHTLNDKKMKESFTIETRPGSERPPELKPGTMVYTRNPIGDIPLHPDMHGKTPAERAVLSTVAKIRANEPAPTQTQKVRRAGIINDKQAADFMRICDDLRAKHDYTWADIAVAVGYAGSWGVQQAYNNGGATSESYYHRLVQHYNDIESGKVESIAKRRAVLRQHTHGRRGKALVGKQLIAFNAILDWLIKAGFTYSDISLAAGYIGRRNPKEIPSDDTRLAALSRYVESQGTTVDKIVEWHRSPDSVRMPVPGNPQKRGSRVFDLGLLETPAPPVKRKSPAKTRTQVAVDIVKAADQKNVDRVMNLVEGKPEHAPRPSFAERMAAQEAAAQVKPIDPFEVIGVVKSKLESASTDLGNLLANQKLPPFMKEGLKRANDAIIQLIADHFEA